MTGVAVCFGACRNAGQIGRTTVRGIRAGPVEDLTFDTLIVDEAQDFEGDWFDYFAQARLELGTVTWPNGADLDPSLMHDQIRQSKTWSVPEVSACAAPA